MDYRIRWADLGPYTHAALGVTPSRRVLVVNTRDIPASGDLALLLRQAVDVAMQTPWGLALMQDKDKVLSDMEPRLLQQRRRFDVDTVFAQLTAVL